MKPHGERILGYLGLLKAWKEDRPPTPSDLKAWQEIWTISDQDLELIREMAFRAHRQGRSAWDRGDRDRALEIWQESWSLAPRDREMLEEVQTLLAGWSADHGDTAKSYSRRLSYLIGTAPWAGLPPSLRRYVGAVGVSVLILGGLVALLPLLGPFFLPPQSALESKVPEGPVRNLPVGMEANLQGINLKAQESVLSLYPESAVLSVRGKMESPEGHFSGISFRIGLVDSTGTRVMEQSFTPDKSRADLWGGGSILPFRKDFLLPLDPRLEDVRRLDLEAQGIPAPGPMRATERTYLAPEYRAGELRPQVSLRSQSWTSTFFSWSQKLVLEAENSGTKPLKELALGLVWKDARGQPLFTRNVNLTDSGYPPLEAGEKFFYSLDMEFPSEVFPFEKEGFPVLEAQWIKVD